MRRVYISILNLALAEHNKRFVWTQKDSGYDKRLCFAPLDSRVLAALWYL
jgi:hypothetical protein